MKDKRILIVEDQQLISTNIKLLLKFNNYEIAGIAETADQAFEILDNEKVDLILMDIALPGSLDGIQAAEIIIGRFNLPIVYLTVKKDAETLKRAKKTAPYGYITKDIELKEQLPIVVDFALYKHQSEKEKKAQEKALAESEEKFRSIVNSARDAIIFIDGEGKITSWNPAAEEIFGYKEKEVQNNKLTDVLAPKFYLDEYEERFTEFKNDGEGEFIGKPIELELRSKDGDIIPIESSIATIKVKDNWNACCIFRDISKRRESEEEIERLVQELQYSKEMVEQNANEIINLNTKLEESQDMLKELNASKDRFFSIIAHDLKGPFQGFLGYSEILSQDLDALSDDEVQSFAKELYDSAKQLFKLLENLLQWSRLQRGAIQREPINVNLKQLVNMIFDILSTQANQKNITLENEAPEDLSVFTDMNMLNTILRNFVGNSIKFTEEGGTIKVGADAIEDGKARIHVIDNGIGMSDEAKSKIFKIDQRHTTTGTANEKGTGLGLILCKELIEKNEGEVWVESEEGKGTAFYFTAPIGNEQKS